MRTSIVPLVLVAQLIAGAAEAEKLCLKVSLKKTGKISTQSAVAGVCPKGYKEGAARKESPVI